MTFRGVMVVVERNIIRRPSEGGLMGMPGRLRIAWPGIKESTQVGIIDVFLTTRRWDPSI